MQQYESQSHIGDDVEEEPAVAGADPPHAASAPTELRDDGARSPDDSGYDRIAAEVAALTAQIVATNDRAAAREGVIERLFDENDRLRAGERAMVLRPVAVDLQRLRNDLLRQADSLPADMSAAQTATLLRSFAFSAEQALERCGVAVIRPQPAEPFDPKLHRAAASVPAPSPDLDAAIAEVIADGYLDSVTDRAITTATVRVHRWVPTPHSPAPDPTPEPAVIITPPVHSATAAEAPHV